LIGFVEDGDIITIDAVENKLILNVSEEVIASRKLNWKKPQLKAKSGLLYKYAKQVSNAANGCVTDDV
jgi:dihydroxy-acid dehydratase